MLFLNLKFPLFLIGLIKKEWPLDNFGVIRATWILEIGMNKNIKFLPRLFVVSDTRCFHLNDEISTNIIPTFWAGYNYFLYPAFILINFGGNHKRKYFPLKPANNQEGPGRGHEFPLMLPIKFLVLFSLCWILIGNKKVIGMYFY